MSHYLRGDLICNLLNTRILVILILFFHKSISREPRRDIVAMIRALKPIKIPTTRLIPMLVHIQKPLISTSLYYMTFCASCNI